MSEEIGSVTITDKVDVDDESAIDALSEKYQSTRVKDTSDYIETTITDAVAVQKDRVYVKVCVGGVEYGLLLPPVHLGSYRRQKETWELYQSIIDSRDVTVQEIADSGRLDVSIDDFIDTKIRVDFTDSLNESCFINGSNIQVLTELWDDVSDESGVNSYGNERTRDRAMTHMSLLAEYFNSPDPITCDVEVNTEETTDEKLVVDLTTVTGGTTLQKEFAFDESGKQAPAPETRQFIEEVGDGRVKGVNVREAVYLHPDQLLDDRSSEYVSPDTLGVDSVIGEWHVLTDSQEEHRVDALTGRTTIAFGEWLAESSMGVYPMAVLVGGYLLVNWLEAMTVGQQVWTYELLGSVLLSITVLHFVLLIGTFEYVKRKYRYSIIGWVDVK